MTKALTAILLFTTCSVMGQVVKSGFQSLSGNQIVSAAADTNYAANATRFTTTTDILSRGSIGSTDGTVGLISFWIKFNAGSGANKIIFTSSGGDFIIQKLASDAVRLTIYDTTATLSVNITSTATTLANGSWHHVLVAWDSASSANCNFVVDGVAGTTINTRISATLDYTWPSWFFSIDAANGLDADVCEVWIAPNEWLDITSPANVQKFRSASAKPVNLGSTGNLPTGNQPWVYFKNPFSSFGVNSGSGGNFTVGGTLDLATPP